MLEKIRITKDKKAFQGIETGLRGGQKSWYTARAEGQAMPSDRALWCQTKKQALESAGAANVGHGI